MLRWRAKRGLMRLALAWVFVYPALCISLNAWHTAQTQARLTAEAQTTRQTTRQTVRQVVLLPDAFGPLFWRVLYETDGPDGRMVHSQGLNALGQPRTAPSSRRAAPPELLAELARQSVAADAFFNFTLLPVISPLANEFIPVEAHAAAEAQAGTAGDGPAAQVTPAAPAGTAGATGAPDATGTAGDGPAAQTRPTYALFNDLRFGSDLALVRAIIAHRPHADIPFKYMVELDLADPGQSVALVDDGKNPGSARLVRERLRFSDSGKDSHWQKPRLPSPPPFRDWIMGLR